MYEAAHELSNASHGAEVAGLVISPAAPCGKPPVLIGGQMLAHVQCVVVCTGAGGKAHPPNTPAKNIVATGATKVFVHGAAAARFAPSGDVTTCAATLSGASHRVYIGSASEGPASAAARQVAASSDASAAAVEVVVAALVEVEELDPGALDEMAARGERVVVSGDDGSSTSDTAIASRGDAVLTYRGADRELRIPSREGGGRSHRTLVRAIRAVLAARAARGSRDFVVTRTSDGGVEVLDGHGGPR